MQKQFTNGFTLIELLVVIAVIGILASLLLPALGRAKFSSQSASCISNLKQLQLGYLSYVDDNEDWLPLNRARSFGLGDVRNVEGSWVLGNAQRDTNTAKIKAGTIYPHVNAAGVYRCPADKSKAFGTNMPRTRSYSIEGWLNAYYTAKGFDFGPEFYPWAKLKLSEILDPSAVFGFIDEQEQSIDAGVFVLVQPKWVTPESGSKDYWYSLPADRHQQGCNLSFLDGRVEHWRWKAPKVFRQFLAPARTDADDLRRLQEAIPHNVTAK